MSRVLQFYADLAPWFALSLLFMGRNPYPDRRRIVGSLLIAAGTLLWPVGGFPIGHWIVLLESNPSLPLTALLAIALWQRIGGRPLFRPQDWNAAWLFGSLAALLLYPMGLGLTSWDSYGWGWSPILPVGTAVISTVLLLRDNRFGILLLFPLAGFLLPLQESRNFWDALIDPFYAVFSLVALMVMLLRRLGQ